MIYKIPVLERQAFSDETVYINSKYISVEDIGLRFFYQHDDSDRNFINQFYKKHTLSKEEIFFLVIADDADRAIAIFYNNWEGARIGGDRPEQKALQIDKSKIILEMPLCRLMRKNIDNRLICGPISSKKYESSLCISEEDDEEIYQDAVEIDICICPIRIFYESIKLEKKMGSLCMIRTSWGFKYIPYMLKIDE